MKFNFGYKIAIVYTLFALGMVGILVMSMQFDHELVTENYYENELNYQGRKDAFHNMETAPFKVFITQMDGEVLVSFDGLTANQQASGTLSFYKPDKADYDEEHPIQLNADGRMRVAPKAPQGRLKVALRFTVDKTDYYVHKEIIL